MHDKEKKSIKFDAELIQVLELVDKDVKLVIVTVFYRFQKLSRDMENYFDPNQASRGEKYNIRGLKKCTG